VLCAPAIAEVLQEHVLFYILVKMELTILKEFARKMLAHLKIKKQIALDLTTIVTQYTSSAPHRSNVKLI
jgi:hypothetical protein